MSPLWINQINDNHAFTLENKTNVICNTYVKNLIRVKKGSRIFYDTFVDVKNISISLRVNGKQK